MAKKQGIHFILTGGTIDAYYEGSKDTVMPLKKSAIPNYIKSIKIYGKPEFTQICMKDSRDITKKDLKNILKAIQKSSHKRIIITHGTYTMSDTARYLKQKLKRDDQTIIFTGSMIPLSGFTNSDAPFNLGYSIAKAQELSPGTYVCMNAKIFAPEEVAKILSAGRFTSLFTEW